MFATASILINPRAKWIRALDNLRMQIVISGIVLSVWMSFLLNPNDLISVILFISLISSTFYLLYSVLPYTPVFKKQVKDIGHFSDEYANDYSFGILLVDVKRENKNSKGLVKTIMDSDPDLILLSETDNWWTEKMRVLDSYYPFSVTHPSGKSGGMMLFSKLRLVNSEVKFLTNENVPSIHATVELETKERLKLYYIHPEPAESGINESVREAELLSIGKLAKDSRHPVIVAGNFKEAGWSGTVKLFQKISGLCDAGIGRKHYGSYNTRFPLFRWGPDRFFLSNEFQSGVITLKPAFGSDHFPLFIRLCLKSILNQDRSRKATGYEIVPSVRTSRTPF